MRWIGAQITVLPAAVEVSVPPDKLEELLHFAARLQSAHVCGVRPLRTFAGKVAFFAGLIPLIRPFLASIWAALASPTAAAGSAALVHTKRIARSLRWIQAFAHGHLGGLRRSHPLCASDGDSYFIVTDASPWGIGGVLFHEAVPASCFADHIHLADLRRFQASVGDPAFNTLWELLAILVALRLWLPVVPRQAQVTVKSDSHGSLCAIHKLSSSSPSMSMVLAELALDFAVCPESITALQHIPGVSNTLADPLSRLWAPEPAAFPEALEYIPGAQVPPRRACFWKTIRPPAVPPWAPAPGSRPARATRPAPSHGTGALAQA